jgi:glutathione peroxidase
MTTSLEMIPVRRLDGQETSLGAYAGKVRLVVNVASKCGLTPQYSALEALYRKYRGLGLEILGFPANEFGAQEPGSNAEIQSFCSTAYDVSFPMFSKLVVKGPGQHPLYRALTLAQPEARSLPGSNFRAMLVKHGIDVGLAHDILWNFEKFLVNRRGEVIARFAPDVPPDSELLVSAIDRELSAKRLAGLRVFITGATSGVGEAFANRAVAEGASLSLHGRDPAKVNALVARLGQSSGAKARAFVADLSSLAEVARLAKELAEAGPLDVLINNAGVGFGSDAKRRELSRDGFELRFAVNFLAPFLLTELLTERGLPGRAVVNVASAGQAALDENDLMSERNYDGVLAYRRSKLALISDSFERARRDPDRAYVALHPGTFLATQMVREANITPQGTAEQGSNALLYVVEQALAGHTAVYFDQERPALAEPAASDAAAQARLRATALELTARFRRS